MKIYGPLLVLTHRGESFFINFVDEYSEYGMIIFLASFDQVLGAL